MRTSQRVRIAAGLVAGATLLPLTAAGGATTQDAPRVTNRETVYVDLHPSGEVDTARLFSQLLIEGDGSYFVVDPTSTKNLRNLDGFSAPSVTGDVATWQVDVDGSARRRTVADFTGQLPVTVQARYKLDGRDIDPDDIVGKSGRLEVSYRVKNVTAQKTPITYVDGKGVRQSTIVDVTMPFVGQLQTDLPARFTALDAPRADVAGDGHGGSIVAYTMVLFEPVGDPLQYFGWSAQIVDGEVPPVVVQLIPVAPAHKPELAFAEHGYADGAAQATTLTLGAGQIDENVLKLAAGAGTLLDGLTKLAAGAAELKAGLAGEAAPGAKQIADGLSDALDGGTALHAGLGDLADGATELTGGAEQVADGLTGVGDGLGQLAAAIDGLADDPGFLQLKNGLASIIAGLGSASSPLTILGALNAVEGGLLQMSTSATAGLPAVVTGVETLKAGLQSAKTAITTMAGAMGQQLGAINGASATLGCPGSLNPVCPLLAGAVSINGAVTDGLTNADPALGLGAGVDAAIAGIGSSSTPGQTVLYGLASAIAGIGSTSVPGNTLLYGLHQAILGLDHPAGAGGASDPGGVKQGITAISGGLDLLVDGITSAVAGALGQPSDAATASLRGAVQALGTGAGKVADGAGQVADGAGTAADGAGELEDGLGQLSTGAGDLADGLGDASDGAGQIADGLGQAAGGAQELGTGAGRISKEGTSVLAGMGNESAAGAARKLAMLQALDARAASGGLPYGAPAGGQGSAAYLMTLAAANAQGSENAGRAAIAVGAFVLAGLVGTVLRRRSIAFG